MKNREYNLKTSFMIWFTTSRTEGIFYSEVKKLSSITVYNPKCFSGLKIEKISKLFFMLKNKNCRGILVDNSGGAKTLMIVIVSKIFHVPIFTRLRGGMSGEFFDKLDIKNPFVRHINALWQKFKRRQLLYASEIIFPVSIFSKSQVLYELPGVDVNRLRALYKPVDFEAIDRAEKGRLHKSLDIGENGKILMSATNFNYRRKYEALLFYHNIILKALQENPNWVYVILGAGAGLEHFKNTVARHTPKTLQKRIFIMGFHSNIYEALSDADLFIYLSYRDAGPQVVKEAQASRLPVIANYSCFGSNEFIPNNHDGINLLFEDPNELSILLEKLFSDDNLRNKLGIINRRHAEKYYQPEDAARKFLKEAVDD